jgi:hypothetical protein
MRRFVLFLPCLWLATAAAVAPTPKPAAACQPHEAANACAACHESNCCTERRACENDSACAAFVTCVKKGGQCGTIPQAFVAQFACQMEKCNTTVCGGPVDACSLCAGTACAGPMLACLHQADCGAHESCVAACGKDGACADRCPKITAAARPVWEKKDACLKKLCRDVCR